MTLTWNDPTIQTIDPTLVINGQAARRFDDDDDDAEKLTDCPLGRMSSSLTELTMTGCRALPNDTGNDTLYLEAMDKLPELRTHRGLSVLNDTKQCFQKEDDVMQALQKIKNSSGDLRVDVNSTAFVPICQHLVGRNETIMSTDVFIHTFAEFAEEWDRILRFLKSDIQRNELPICYLLPKQVVTGSNDYASMSAGGSSNSNVTGADKQQSNASKKRMT